MGVGVSVENCITLAVRESAARAAAVMSGAADLLLFLVASPHEGASVAAAAAGLAPRVCGSSCLAFITREGVFSRGVAAVGFRMERAVIGPYVCRLPWDGATSQYGPLGRELLQEETSTSETCADCYSFAFLLGSVSPSLVSALYDTLGPSFPFMGGLLHRQEGLVPYVFAGDKVVPQGVLALGFSASTPFRIDMQHGWQPIGRPVLVTYVGNQGIELENRPAWDAYREIVSEHSPKVDWETVALGQNAKLPLGIPTYSGHYVVYDARFTRVGQAIQCQARVPEGAIVRIMHGTTALLEAATQSCAQSVVGGSTPAGLLGVSCSSRHSLYGNTYENEWRILCQEVLPTSPFLVLRASGEIGPFADCPVTFLNKMIGLAALPRGVSGE